MKKYEVIRNYTDRETRKSHWEGTTVELDPKRGKELTAAGFVKEVKKGKADKEEENVE